MWLQGRPEEARRPPTCFLPARAGRRPVAEEALFVGAGGLRRAARRVAAPVWKGTGGWLEVLQASGHRWSAPRGGRLRRRARLSGPSVSGSHDFSANDGPRHWRNRAELRKRKAARRHAIWVLQREDASDSSSECHRHGDVPHVVGAPRACTVDAKSANVMSRREFAEQVDALRPEIVRRRSQRFWRLPASDELVPVGSSTLGTLPAVFSAAKSLVLKLFRLTMEEVVDTVDDELRLRLYMDCLALK